MPPCTISCWRRSKAAFELLVPCGTTGEAATLSEAEWLHVVEVTCARRRAAACPSSPAAPINSTRVAVERVRRISQVLGLTGILTANPYYNRPGQEGQYQHFKAIAEATDLPVLLYNIPPRTGANLEPATVLRLAEIPNIVGIKESSGNVVQITELLTQAPRSFRVFAGDDTLALPILALGGAGLISVASNAIPPRWPNWSAPPSQVTGPLPGASTASSSASCRRTSGSPAPPPSRPS